MTDDHLTDKGSLPPGPAGWRAIRIFIALSVLAALIVLPSTLGCLTTSGANRNVVFLVSGLALLLQISMIIQDIVAALGIWTTPEVTRGQIRIVAETAGNRGAVLSNFAKATLFYPWFLMITGGIVVMSYNKAPLCSLP